MKCSIRGHVLEAYRTVKCFRCGVTQREQVALSTMDRDGSTAPFIKWRDAEAVPEGWSIIDGKDFCGQCAAIVCAIMGGKR